MTEKDIADPSVVQTVRQIEKTGQEMYKAFVEERFIKREKKVFDPIKKNLISLFRTPTAKTATKEKSKISILKYNCSLFPRLYILVYSKTQIAVSAKKWLEVTSSAIVVLTAFLDSPNLPKESLSGLKRKFSWRDT